MITNWDYNSIIQKHDGSYPVIDHSVYDSDGVTLVGQVMRTNTSRWFVSEIGNSSYYLVEQYFDNGAS